MSCTTCKGTGMRYVTTGHRMSGYPFSDKHASEPCLCSAGDVVKAQNERTFFPDSVLLEVADRNFKERMESKGMDMCWMCDEWRPKGDWVRVCPKCEGEMR